MKYQQDNYYEQEERFSKRKDSKKLTAKRSVNDLYTGKNSGEALADAATNAFSEPALQTLFERGYLTEILGDLKSGKEATVYLATGPEGLMACKIYSDMQVRSFKNDGLYRAGRFVGDARIEKAIKQRSLAGVNAQQAFWVFHEYVQLWELYRAGVSVPKPMVGPDTSDMMQAGRVVLMEFIGSSLNGETHVAPRLSDIRLEAKQAESAWQQSLDILLRLAELGKVHGDYSTYNLLWWQDKVIVIDFPQMADIKENPNALMLLERDALSLCKTFRKHGLSKDSSQVFGQLRERAEV